MLRENPGGLLPFHYVAAIVELGHKYQIDHLCAEGLDRMKTCFCHRFSTMQSTAEFGSMTPHGGTTSELGLYSSTLQVRPSRDAIRAVNLVRLVGEDSMLPVAFYLCTLLPVATLLSGTAMGRGLRHTLSGPDLALCLEARTRLAMRASQRVQSLWDPLCCSNKCFTANTCDAALWTHRRAQRQLDRAVQSIPSVFENLERRIRSAKADGLCEACIEAVLFRHVEEMRFIWKKLPEDLDLEIAGWDADNTAAP
ncbi:hypothetical protein TRAPUB_2308 [Trametes pubescens]|uniref:Uncharacterized protein n=1 Tax=Trametes pubescens TaxID=154538 RepID=A0A1M2VGW2_TRAPU|nr:hypothetical protein TRAPUB_2308 [Trametes pubescens]